MRLGLFVDLRDAQDTSRSRTEHYRRTLDRVTTAERLGFDSVWLTEHHFFADGYLSQPLVVAAALATTTTTMRIGTAVLIAPLRHPLHIAEQAALVDVLSGGRLDLGLGAGWSREEYAAFGVDLARRYRLTDEAVVRIRQHWQDERVAPATVQRPLPLWLGYQGPKGARRAGRLGVGLLSMDRTLLDPYRMGLEEGGHTPGAARMAGLVEIVVADDPERAYERILPSYVHQVNTYRQARSSTATVLSPAEVRQGGSLRVMTPRDAAAAIRDETRDLPVVDVRLWLSVGGMPEDLVDRHLELAATQVRPLLADRGSR